MSELPAERRMAEVVVRTESVAAALADENAKLDFERTTSPILLALRPLHLIFFVHALAASTQAAKLIGPKAVAISAFVGVHEVSFWPPGPLVEKELGWLGFYVD